jgi:hypothetical protein
MQPIDLSCASFIPEFALTVFVGGAPLNESDQSNFAMIRSEVMAHLNRLTSRATQSRVLDGGECLLQDSCRAQFGKAPDFHLCGAGEGVCSFNTTTGKGMPNNRGTCAAMCQQFRDSQCVAALNNNPNDPPGCTPNPNSRDTCETPRQTEICICERR